MPGFYVDNAMNRRLGRVGMPRGSMPVSRDGIHLPPMFYVDNSMNRSLGRVGMFRGSMPVSRDDVPLPPKTPPFSLPTPRNDDYFEDDALRSSIKVDRKIELEELKLFELDRKMLSSFSDNSRYSTNNKESIFEDFHQHIITFPPGMRLSSSFNKNLRRYLANEKSTIGKLLNSQKINPFTEHRGIQFGMKENKETKKEKKTVQVVKGEDSKHRLSEVKTPISWSVLSDGENEQFGNKDSKETKKGKKTVRVFKGEESQHSPSEFKTPFLWSKVSTWEKDQLQRNDKSMELRNKNNDVKQVLYNNSITNKNVQRQTFVEYEQDSGLDLSSLSIKHEHLLTNRNDFIEGHKTGPETLYNNSNTPYDNSDFETKDLTKENISFDQNLSHDSGIDISWSSPKSPSLQTKKGSLRQRKPNDHNEGERNICTGLWVKSKTPSSVKSAAKRQFLNPNRSLGNNKDLSYGSQHEIHDFNDDEIDFFDVQLIQQIHNEWFRDIYMAKWKGSLVTVNLLNCHRSNEQIFNSFMDEICLLREINHPNIVKFLGASITAPNVCSVCEYMQSSVYDSLHMQGTQFEENEKLKIIQQTSLGLAYLHDSNIAHCNITSKNILLNHAPGQTLVVKIANFSHSMTDELRRNETGGKFCNTKISQYSSPEILRGDLLSVNYLKMADVYSFSLLVFEIIVEKEPFANLDYPNLKENVGLLGLIPVVPDHIAIEHAFHNLMQACWDREPSRRPNAKHICTMVSKLNHIYIFSVYVPRLSALYFSCIMLITLVINLLPCGEVSTGWCIVTLLFIVTCFILIHKKEISNKSNCNMLDGFGIVDDFD